MKVTPYQWLFLTGLACGLVFLAFYGPYKAMGF